MIKNLSESAICRCNRGHVTYRYWKGNVNEYSKSIVNYLGGETVLGETIHSF